MPSPLMSLARRKAGLASAYGREHEKTRAADSALRILKAKLALEQLTDAERAELDALMDLAQNLPLAPAGTAAGRRAFRRTGMGGAIA